MIIADGLSLLQVMDRRYVGHLVKTIGLVMGNNEGLQDKNYPIDPIFYMNIKKMHTLKIRHFFPLA